MLIARLKVIGVRDSLIKIRECPRILSDFVQFDMHIKVIPKKLRNDWCDSGLEIIVQ